MTMIEKVARAISGRDPDELVEISMLEKTTHIPVYKMVPKWTLRIEQARAAIEAMREPTEAMTMVNGPGNQHNYADAEAAATWRKMIDAALKEQA